MSVVIAHCCETFSFVATEDLLYHQYYQIRDVKLYYTEFGYCAGVGAHTDIVKVVNGIKSSNGNIVALTNKLEEIKTQYQSLNPESDSFIVLPFCSFLNGKIKYKLLQIAITTLQPFLSIDVFETGKTLFYAPHSFFSDNNGKHMVALWEKDMLQCQSDLPLCMKNVAQYIDYISDLCPTHASDLCYFGISAITGWSVYKIKAKRLISIYDRARNTMEFFENLSSFRVLDGLRNQMCE